MKRMSKSIVLIIVLIFCPHTFAQTKEEKLSAATKLFSEAEALFHQETTESYEAALEKFRQASRIYEELGDNSETAGLSLLFSGLISNNLGRNQDALEFYEKALRIFRQSNNLRIEAVTLNNIGIVYSDLGEKQKVLEYYNQALPLQKQIGDREGEATTLNRIARVYYGLGEKQKALEYYNQALPLLKQLGDKEEEATALNNIGIVYYGLGENQKALEYYNQALPLRKQVGNKEGEATTLNNIGSVYYALDNQQKALEYYNQALPLQKQIGDKEGEAATLNDIGTAYAALSEQQKALEFYNQALPLLKQLGDKSGEARALNNIGGVYSEISENQKALEFYNQALPLHKQIGNKEGEATTLSNIGAVYYALSENQKALEYYNQALPLQKQIGDREGEATTLNNIGLVYSDLGEQQKALEYYNHTLALLKQIGDKSGEARSLSNLMYVWEKLQVSQTAIFYGKQSVNVYQQLRSSIKGLDKSIQQTFTKSIEHTYRGLADILISEDRLLEAQAVLDLLKEEEFSGLVKRAGESSATVPYSKSEDAAINIVNRIAALGREKSELSEKNEKATLNTAERQRFREIQNEIEIAESEFSNSIKALSENTTGGQSLDAVAANSQSLMEDLRGLGNGAVARYTVILENKDAGANSVKTGWIIFVTPEFRKAYPVDVTDLDKKIFRLRTALSSPVYDPQPLAQEIYKKLFLQTSAKQTATLAGDLDEYFKGKTDKTLMWSLDGVLRYVPLAALHDGKNYLVEKYRNTVFTAASIGRLNVPLKPKWTVLGLGVSQPREEAGKKFNALDGAKRELQLIVKPKNSTNTGQGLLNGTITMDEEFTAETFFDSLSFEKNPVVHIASHFSYDAADFDKSFLLLGKGKLSMDELSAKTTLFSNVDLLTLSACETAVGNANGKELEGFAFKAQKAGAKAVIATLWQVDDIGTQVLMPEFYRLRETGLDKAESLRQAQIALLNGKIKFAPTETKRAELIGAEKQNTDLLKYQPNTQKPFAHPYYWSPFILIGNWK